MEIIVVHFKSQITIMQNKLIAVHLNLPEK